MNGLEAKTVTEHCGDTNSDFMFHHLQDMDSVKEEKIADWRHLAKSSLHESRNDGTIKFSETDQADSSCNVGELEKQKYLEEYSDLLS